jgi:hypothetical protein
MKLKLDENGNAVLVDGKPVYVHDDGKEIPFDAARTVETISRLNKEAQTHREAKEAAEGQVKTLGEQMKVFEGLDPEASRKAIQRAKDIDDGKLIESGKLDEVRTAAQKEYEARFNSAAKTHSDELAAMKAVNEKLNGHLNNEIVGGSFARSKYIADNLAIPQDLVQAAFGKSFKVEEGKLVAVDASGNKMFSRNRPGELADFDEALGMLVEQYPNRDHILKSSGASGTGASASKGGEGAGKTGVTRAQFNEMSPAQQMAHFKAGNSVTD